MNFGEAGQIRSAHTIVDLGIECDFAVVGSGAGGSVAAATLANAGARVAIIEEGRHHTRKDFNMQEAWAYPALYQEHGNRTTDDLAIMVLQGRSVGGGTTVNWTSSFRTPVDTLSLWAKRHGVKDLDEAALAPHFQAVEERLSIHADEADVNANNRKLLEGAKKLGWNADLIRRNVRGCARLGYCGMGCPTDAKQSALITYIPDAVAAGTNVLTDLRARLVQTDRGRAQAVVCDVLDGDGRPSRRFVVHARRGVVLAAGAINTPALLLRSHAGTASGVVGKRTFLHPTIPVIALYDEPIEAFYGAPQSVSSRQFVQRGGDRVGYFLETAPVHPMLAAIAVPGFGGEHREGMQKLAHVQATIALLIDGHRDDDEGGSVSVDGDGRTKLAYPLTAPICEAATDAIKSIARLQLAAGAREVVALHEEPVRIRSESDIAKIDDARFGPNQYPIFSAHQMGGCTMGSDPRRSVVDSRGRHHEIENLWIVDGSIFPTSLGVNPQLSIYACARLFASSIPKS